MDSQDHTDTAGGRAGGCGGGTGPAARIIQTQRETTGHPVTRTRADTAGMASKPVGIVVETQSDVSQTQWGTSHTDTTKKQPIIWRTR